jgi:hypothetical protein
MSTLDQIQATLLSIVSNNRYSLYWWMVLALVSFLLIVPNIGKHSEVEAVEIKQALIRDVRERVKCPSRRLAPRAGSGPPRTKTWRVPPRPRSA